MAATTRPDKTHDLEAASAPTIDASQPNKERTDQKTTPTRSTKIALVVFLAMLMATVLGGAAVAIGLATTRSGSSDPATLAVTVKVELDEAGLEPIIHSAIEANHGTYRWHIIYDRDGRSEKGSCTHLLHADGLEYTFKSADCSLHSTSPINCIARNVSEPSDAPSMASIAKIIGADDSLARRTVLSASSPSPFAAPAACELASASKPEEARSAEEEEELEEESGLVADTDQSTLESMLNAGYLRLQTIATPVDADSPEARRVFFESRVVYKEARAPPGMCEKAIQHRKKSCKKNAIKCIAYKHWHWEPWPDPKGYIHSSCCDNALQIKSMTPVGAAVMQPSTARYKRTGTCCGSATCTSVIADTESFEATISFERSKSTEFTVGTEIGFTVGGDAAGGSVSASTSVSYAVGETLSEGHSSTTAASQEISSTCGPQIQDGMLVGGHEQFIRHDNRVVKYKQELLITYENECPGDEIEETAEITVDVMESTADCTVFHCADVAGEHTKTCNLARMDSQRVDFNQQQQELFLSGCSKFAKGTKSYDAQLAVSGWTPAQPGMTPQEVCAARSGAQFALGTARDPEGGLPKMYCCVNGYLTATEACPAPDNYAVFDFSSPLVQQGWSNGPSGPFTNVYPFIRKSGGTPSRGTGPSAGVGGSGYYYYAECSWRPNNGGAHQKGDLYRLAYDGSVCTSKGLSVKWVSFRYHMSSQNRYAMGTLRLKDSGENEVWKKAGHQDDAWLTASVFLSDSDGGFVFEYERAWSWQADAAITHVTVFCQ